MGNRLSFDALSERQKAHIDLSTLGAQSVSALAQTLKTACNGDRGLNIVISAPPMCGSKHFCRWIEVQLSANVAQFCSLPREEAVAAWIQCDLYRQACSYLASRDNGQGTPHRETIFRWLLSRTTLRTEEAVGGKQQRFALCSNAVSLLHVYHRSVLDEVAGYAKAAKSLHLLRRAHIDLLNASWGALTTVQRHSMAAENTLWVYITMPDTAFVATLEKKFQRPLFKWEADFYLAIKHNLDTIYTRTVDATFRPGCRLCINVDSPVNSNFELANEVLCQILARLIRLVELRAVSCQTLHRPLSTRVIKMSDALKELSTEQIHVTTLRCPGCMEATHSDACPSGRLIRIDQLSPRRVRRSLRKSYRSMHNGNTPEAVHSSVGAHFDDEDDDGDDVTESIKNSIPQPRNRSASINSTDGLPTFRSLYGTI